jgi:hypothetical protein
MSCYICLEESVRTPDIGTCDHCSRHACGKPPQRRDLLFHGDVCATYGCGVFYCERHLHAHAHSSHGTSQAFPSMAFSVSVRGVAAAAALRNVHDPRTELAVNERYQRDINRYLNIIAPGSDALRDLREMIPEGMYRIVTVGNDEAVQVLPEFFTREVLSAVLRMAFRSVRISASVLKLPDPSAARANLWQGLYSLRVAYALRALHLAEEMKWFRETARQLPADGAVENVERIPPESDPTELARFFLSQRGEGQPGAVLAF